MRFFLNILILVLIIPASLSSQAEYIQVRKMFSKPNAYIPVQVWKGLMFNSHPVEFYLAEREREVNGYYRIISSGAKFFLEGEVVNDDYVVSEVNSDSEVVGTFVLKNFRVAEERASRSASWYNKEQSDVLPFSLFLSSYSDNPPSVYKPLVKKYSGVNSVQSVRKFEQYFIELINEQEVVVHYGNLQEGLTERLDVIEINPLKFHLTIDDKLAIFEEIGSKLRRRFKGEFAYFPLQNEASFKKIAYANEYFICDVDFPVINDTSFDSWIEDLVEARKQSARKFVAAEVELDDLSTSDTHFKYKWLGWTEIDLLSDELVSGRIVFSRSWSNDQDIIAFTFDLTKGEPILLIEEFKRDFDMKDYLNRVVQGKIGDWKLEGANINPALEANQFVNLTVSDYHLIVSNDFDRVYGYQKIEIPFSELKGLVKRNSILKNLMR